MPHNFDNLKDTIIHNTEMGWWEDDEENYMCNNCKCPLIMHRNTIGCGSQKNSCQNPKCDKKV